MTIPLRSGSPSPVKVTISSSDLSFYNLPLTTNFNSFVINYCKGVNVNQAMDLVNRGKNIARWIQAASGRELDLDYPERRLSYLAPFHWYLMYLAVNQEKPFFEGMIIFKDPGHRFTNYFKGADGAYRRWMSHYCGRVPTTPIFGKKTQVPPNYDSFWGFNANAVDLPLSANKQTVIFSELKMLDEKEGEWSMIKAEDHSAHPKKPLSFLIHGVHWVTRSVLPRLLPGPWRTHGKEGYREELVRPNLLHDFFKLVNQLFKGKTVRILDQKKHAKDKARMYGVAAINHFLEGAFSPLNQTSRMIEQLRLSCENISPKHKHLVKGDEVVLESI
jgi:hypothetical protein